MSFIAVLAICHSINGISTDECTAVRWLDDPVETIADCNALIFTNVRHPVVQNLLLERLAEKYDVSVLDQVNITSYCVLSNEISDFMKNNYGIYIDPEI